MEEIPCSRLFATLCGDFAPTMQNVPVAEFHLLQLKGKKTDQSSKIYKKNENKRET